MTPVESLKKKRDEAEQALHELETGQQVSVFVDQNGERIEYRASNSSRLRTYISELTRRINAATRRSNPYGRPMKVYF